jgi:hypothetical protein
MRLIHKIFSLPLIVATLLTLGDTANAQPPVNQRLAALRVQNAFQQQQAALQLAVQQTNLLRQRAIRQDTSLQPSGFFTPLSFGSQQAALQLALQQSIAATQAASALTMGRVQPASQTSAIQSVLQTSAILQTMTQIQNGQLTADQVQSLFNEQAVLSNLLAVPVP